jgi:putative Ca2+/H+ antiporter (TMEM165/GDT1 family)
VIEGFATAFALVFVAELGDKSMLLALTLGTRYPAWWVLAAIAVESAVVMALAVAGGALAGALLPALAVAALSGVLFVSFGLWSLRDAAADEDAPTLLRRGAVATIAALATSFFVSELGDKTQVAAISLAGLERAGQVGVWAGATLGMVAGDGIAIAAGRQLQAWIPARVLRVAAAWTFVAFGVGTLVFAAVDELWA